MDYILILHCIFTIEYGQDLWQVVASFSMSGQILGQVEVNFAAQKWGNITSTIAIAKHDMVLTREFLCI